MSKLSRPKPKRKSNTLKLIAAGIIILLVAGMFTYTTSLKKAEIIPAGCDFTTLGIDQIQTVSNEPSLNYEKAYLLTVRADKGGECFKIQLSQEDLAKFGIKDFLLQNITLTGKVNDLSLDYRVYDDTILYKIYESTSTSDLGDPIPYNGVSLKTTQLSALGKYSDPNGQAPPLSHLGSFPSGGDVNLMKDVGKWAYVMPEASNIPFGKDRDGNWWVTHFGGVPYYRGYYIDTMPINKYSVMFALVNAEGEQLAKATMDDQNKIESLGSIARIKFTGSDIEAAFPPQPSRYYYLTQGLEGTPVKDRWKFVSSYRYESYKSSLDLFVNYDNNYFVRSWSDMSGTLMLNSTPNAVDVYMDNKYLGFTPLTLPDIPIGRHTLVAKKRGYYDAEQVFNMNPTVNKLNIKLAEIAPPDVSISLNPTTVVKGKPATLSWSVKGVFEKVKLYDPTPSTVESTGTRTVYPAQDITYVVEAIGAGGEKSASARIGVVLPPPPDVKLTITPATITQGQSATLSWSANGDVSQVTLVDNNVPVKVAATNSRAVSPSTSTTYTVEAIGEGGKSFATARLQVNPPPPPPPPPPVRRDPGVGRADLTMYENNLNNMLGLMASESVAPQDCIFNEDSMTVSCRPTLPIAYPKFQILIKAKAVAMEINAGMPKISKVTLTPQPLYAGTPLQAVVDIGNVGIVSDGFDLSLQSSPSLSAGTQQFSLSPNQTTTASIPFSGAKGNHTAKIVLQSRNNPLAKAVREVNIQIIEKPLPDEIKKLEKQTSVLEDLVAKGFSRVIQILIIVSIGAVIALVVILKRRKWK